MTTRGISRRRSQALGIANKAQGKGFEKDLEFAHTVYRVEHVADVKRLPVPTVPAPRNPRYRILSERTGFDYQGWISLDGAAPIPVVMEAKSSRERIRALPINQSKLKPHQFEALALAAAWGVPSFIVWRNGDDRLLLASKGIAEAWSRYQTARRGTRSIQASEFTPYRLETFCGTGPIEHWLGPVLPALSRLRRPEPD